MKSVHFFFALAIMTFTASTVSAYDPSPLQDFCVAIDDPKRMLFVNGRFCKNPALVEADDFFTSGLNIAADTNNAVGSNVTAVNVDRIPGLNTLGVSLVRIDFAPYGQNPPHYHPRATEILVVVKGRLCVGFVSSNQDGNRLFARELNEGDVFVFPIGMIHFQFNARNAPAVAFAGLGSQNFGVVTIANAVFGSEPPIDPEVLAGAFMLDRKTVEELQHGFSGY